MNGVWGNNLKVSIFGESHGNGIGITIHGLKSGLEIDLEKVNFEMQRRAPGKNNLSTPRKESDEFEILSGYFEGKTTGAPFCAIIRNSNIKSKDYSKIKNVMRPGHADYTGKMRFEGFNDYRGGGHFSGRITAPLVFAGAICKQILEKENIIIASHIKSIENINDESFLDCKIDKNILEDLHNDELPLLDSSLKDSIKEVILKAKNEKDSVGGIIECGVFGIKAGVGNPFFDSIESVLSHLIFSVPSVKGIEFGLGFDISKMRGSLSNDEFYYENLEIKTKTNNNGGVLGGISTGMPIIFKVAIKPTASIGLEQNTINIETKENTKLSVVGRHDPCIVIRALPVIEAVTAIGIVDLLY